MVQQPIPVFLAAPEQETKQSHRYYLLIPRQLFAYLDMILLDIIQLCISYQEKKNNRWLL